MLDYVPLNIWQKSLINFWAKTHYFSIFPFMEITFLRHFCALFQKDSFVQYPNEQIKKNLSFII